MSRADKYPRLTTLGRKAARADRALGRLYLRVLGTVFLLVGLAALAAAVAAEDFSVFTYWPVLGGVALFLLIARYCFRSQASMTDILAEQTGKPPRPRGK